MTLLVDVAHRLGAFTLAARFASRGGLTAFFGPSGSGKTTLVNAIGGLIRPARGRVVLGGAILLDTEAGVFVSKHRRRIGYVFQEARLFPHLTVKQNLLFGRWFAPKGERGGEFAAVVDLLGIGPLLARRPGALSGGEKQRVAIGRAVLSAPRLLLMDEPLASLDEQRKGEILPFIERLRDEAGVPIVYVSHSIAEVARLATEVVMLDAGRVVASGPPASVLSRRDLAGADAEDESGTLIAARVLGHDEAYGLTRLRCRAGMLEAPRVDLAPGTRVRLRIRARDVMVAVRPPEGLSALNVLAGRVVAIAEAGASAALVTLDCNGVPVLARVTRRSAEALSLAPGRPVFAVVKSLALDRGALARAPHDLGAQGNVGIAEGTPRA